MNSTSATLARCFYARQQRWGLWRQGVLRCSSPRESVRFHAPKQRSRREVGLRAICTAPQQYHHPHPPRCIHAPRAYHLPPSIHNLPLLSSAPVRDQPTPSTDRWTPAPFDIGDARGATQRAHDVNDRQLQCTSKTFPQMERLSQFHSFAVSSALTAAA